MQLQLVSSGRSFMKTVDDQIERKNSSLTEPDSQEKNPKNSHERHSDLHGDFIDRRTLTDMKVTTAALADWQADQRTGVIVGPQTILCISPVQPQPCFVQLSSMTREQVRSHICTMATWQFFGIHWGVPMFFCVCVNVRVCVCMPTPVWVIEKCNTIYQRAKIDAVVWAQGGGNEC